MKRTYLVLIITMLVIGFAAVATNLAINGTINFGFNSNNFNDSVVFTYTNTMNGTATIAENGKSITFKTTKLEDVGQKAIMDFDIANKSSQYDANVTIECGLENEFQSYSQYLEITQDLSDDAFKINAGETKSGRLTITLKKAYNESQEKDIDMLCTIKATPEERDTEGTYTPKEHEYEEILLNGADPVLEATPVEGISLAAETSNKKLIPVTIDEDGKVTRADTTKEWYNYEKKEWANAVILVEDAEDPGINQTILEEQIESYFVWIPKYRYKLFDIGEYTLLDSSGVAYQEKSQEIKIQFGIENTKDEITGECATPNSSNSSGTCRVGDWMTHPAFTSFDVNGFWVGKFETGYKQDGDISDWTKQNAEKNETNAQKVIIKPNIFSWRGINMSNSFYTSYNYIRNLDSHMMKNTEWGAVAYLSHSKYGTCDDNSCSEISKNKSFNTGYLDTSTAYPSSYQSSSTLNNTGIFDMSGGAADAVMAIHAIDGKIVTGQDSQYNSGFNGILDPFKGEQSNYSSGINFEMAKKYYDEYIYDDDSENYKRRILGDATGELGPFITGIKNEKKYVINSWHNTQAWFFGLARPWIVRGGYNGAEKLGTGYNGLFSFINSTGHDIDSISFRIVLAPQ